MISFMLGAAATTAILESFAEGAMLGVSVYLASKGAKKEIGVNLCNIITNKLCSHIIM